MVIYEKIDVIGKPLRAFGKRQNHGIIIANIIVSSNASLGGKKSKFKQKSRDRPCLIVSNLLVKPERRGRETYTS